MYVATGVGSVKLISITLKVTQNVSNKQKDKQFVCRGCDNKITY